MTKIVIWGTGKASYRFVDTYMKKEEFEDVSIVAFVDNSIEMQGTIFVGVNVFSPLQLYDLQFDKLIIISRYYDEIFSQIVRENFINVKRICSEDNLVKETRLNYWKKKQVCIVGDSLALKGYSEFAHYYFNKVDIFSFEEIASIRDDYDSYFICPPRYISDDEIAEYEQRCNALLGERKVISYSEWNSIFTYNIFIGKGKKNVDKNFYVIKVSDPVTAWGNIIPDICNGIEYAKKEGMIPIVDMKYYSNQYLDERKFGKENSWEYYFDQPCSISLEEVYESKNVILSGKYSSNKYIGSYSNLHKQSRVDSYIEDYYRTIFPKDKKVLGVVYRGTDYYSAYNHPRPDSIENFIKKVKKCLLDINYKYVFLATEIEEVVEAFHKEFGSYALYTDQKRYSIDERRLLCNVHFERDDDSYYKGLEYLTVIELLARCDSVLSIPSATVKLAEKIRQTPYENEFLAFDK